MNAQLFTERLLGVSITVENEDKILEYTTTSLENIDEKFFVVTPNPEILVYAHHHPQYKKVLNEAKVALPDGVGLVWAAKVLGIPLQSRITGTDFVERLCEKVSNRPVTVGFLGAREGVAEAAANCLQKKYPSLQISYAFHEWDEEQFKIQSSKINVGHIDFLFVAYGFPKQEQWIHDNLENLPVTAAMGVGGAFDYISGNVGRAPKRIRQLGFEWLWRLARQPWRVKRQVKLVEFMWLVMRARVKL